jgi:hypothetical protein
MPNWVYNGLTIDAEPDVINKIKAQLSEPYETKHLDWQTNEIKSEMVEQPFSFWNIIKPTDLDAYYDKPVTHDQNGRDHWYNWNIRNWGVKWEAKFGDEHHPEDGLSLCYTFETAWGIPDTAMLKLSEQYPTASLELEYEEENGWGGCILYENGTSTETEEYDTKCRDCGALNTLDYCEECSNQLCEKCNNTSEADMDALAECETHKHLAKETVNG